MSLSQLAQACLPLPYSRRVAYLKLVLPGLAVLIVTLVLAWPQFFPDEKRVRLSSRAATQEESETLRVVQARFVGVDKSQRPYVVTAALARQSSVVSQQVDLDTPKADLTIGQGAWLNASSQSGRYMRDDHTLDLQGEVNLFHDNGTEFHTERLHVNLDDNSASSDDPVSGQGPNGTISGQGVRITNRGERILFTGKSKLVIYPNAKKPT